MFKPIPHPDEKRKTLLCEFDPERNLLRFVERRGPPIIIDLTEFREPQQAPLTGIETTK